MTPKYCLTDAYERERERECDRENMTSGQDVQNCMHMFELVCMLSYEYH